MSRSPVFGLVAAALAAMGSTGLLPAVGNDSPPVRRSDDAAVLARAAQKRERRAKSRAARAEAERAARYARKVSERLATLRRQYPDLVATDEELLAGTCYMCGSLDLVPLDKIIGDEYGNADERPCRDCYERMLDTDAREAADFA